MGRNLVINLIFWIENKLKASCRVGELILVDLPKRLPDRLVQTGLWHPPILALSDKFYPNNIGRFMPRYKKIFKKLNFTWDFVNEPTMKSSNKNNRDIEKWGSMYFIQTVIFRYPSYFCNVIFKIKKIFRIIYLNQRDFASW